MTRQTRGLLAHHRLLILYMVYGADHDSIAKRAIRSEKITTSEGFEAIQKRPLKAGEPMTVEEAARAVGMRLKAARKAVTHQEFKDELATQRDAFRAGIQPEAWRTALSIMREAGDGTAADRDTQITAAEIVLGRDQITGGKKAPRTKVENAKGQLFMQPGIVMEMPPEK